MRIDRSLRVVGVHAEGEVGNVVVGGFGQVPGETMFDKRHHLAEHRDWIRWLLLSEPRGQVARNANIVLPSNHPDADAGYVIMESIEYPVMSGSNTICVATVLLETGMVPMVEPVTDPAKGETATIRWVLVHMVEEYCRHAGHADLIRQSIDGATDV